MKKKNNRLPVIAIIVGIISILLGLYFILFASVNDGFYGNKNSSYGAISKLGTSKFGADFYTEIYEATAFTGNAISAIYHILCYGMGAFFIMGGIIDICCFIPKLSNKERE